MDKPARHDYEYRRCGTCNVFMATEPLAGKRMTKVTEHKTKIDWAQFLAEIAADHADADRITLVMDSLNTHRPARSTKPFRRRRPRRCATASSSTTRPGTAAG